MLALAAQPFITEKTAGRYRLEGDGSKEANWLRTRPMEKAGGMVRFRSALGSVGECGAFQLSLPVGAITMTDLAI
jgi:hypothetical protein